MVRTGPSRSSAKRPVLYQLCRAGEIFEVGDGPVVLGNAALVIGRGDPRRTDAGDGRVFVDDPWMSGRHAQITPLGPRPAGTGTDSNVRLQRDGFLPGRFVVEDAGSTNGVLVNGVPSTRAPLLHGDLVETGRTFWVYVEESSTDALLAEPFELGGVSTWTPHFARQLADLLPRVPGPEHMLLVGPEGTGKGFLARTIHVVSGRAGRFVHLDCRERKGKRLLVDLFGDDAHNGRLKDAENGTLFLENVDALALDVQDLLADAMRKRGFTPQGRTKTVMLAARIVASMTPGVDEAVANASLRPGLVDAIGGVQVRMPTIQQRMPDLGLLLDDFLARARGAPAISRDACRAVLKYPFRAHVRAMARTIEAAATLAGTAGKGSIEVMHLPVDVVGVETIAKMMPGSGPASVPENTSEMPAVSTSQPPADFIADDQTDPFQLRQQKPSVTTPPHGVTRSTEATGEMAMVLDPDSIAEAIRVAHGNVSAAARALGRPRAVVLRWIRELGIDPSKLR
jgi:DNA-binding NtrC family response regulator